MGDYSPIDNARIEAIFNSLERDPADADVKLDVLVKSCLTPGKKPTKKLEVDLTPLTDEQIMIKIAFKLAIKTHELDRRDVGDNLYSKHVADTSRILLEYDVGINVDYKNVCQGLLHDTIEETGIDPLVIRYYFVEEICESDIEDKERYLDAVDEIIDLVLNVTKKEGEDYNLFLKRVFEDGRSGKTRLGDRTGQSFEMDPMEYYGIGIKILDYLKHRIEPVIGEERVDRLKEKGAEASELGLRERLVRPADLWYGFLYTLYKNVEHLRLPGSRILGAAYKDFRHIDHACNYININGYDATMAELKDMLLWSSKFRVILPRMNHLVKGRHVSQDEVRYAEEKVGEVEESGELYRLTGIEGSLKETDIILPFYGPAMRGHKEVLRRLDDFSDIQYLHLAMWNELFNRYMADKGKQGGLFTFDWGIPDNVPLKRDEKPKYLKTTVS